jgi:hypothetical protein
MKVVHGIKRGTIYKLNWLTVGMFHGRSSHIVTSSHQAVPFQERLVGIL